MAFHGGGDDDDDMWKCQKHPSRRRQSGVCPSCLRDRLLSLCPDCANVRPCTACLSSGSASFSRFFSAARIDPDSSLRRSRSLALPFLRSRPEETPPPPSAGSTRTRYSSLWSVFKTHKSSKCAAAIEIQRTAEMRRSKSVVEAKLVKSKGWHLPSPISVFRQPKVAVHRSPMCRG